MSSTIEPAVRTAKDALRLLETALKTTRSDDCRLQWQDAERDLESAINYMTAIPSENYPGDVAAADSDDKPAASSTKSAANDRKFSDIQMAVTEAIALAGCMSLSAHARDDIRPDINAACDGLKRMLERISIDLADLEGHIAG